MITVKILDKEYPIAYTIEAQTKFTEKAGSLKKAPTVLSNDPAFALAVMIQAAVHREAVMAKVESRKPAVYPVISEGDLNAILLPADMKDITKSMVEAMNEGFQTDVETAPEKGAKKKQETESR